jgi:succinate dehydrogenase flavin-adding protein (antitoxin of CptAB toxin-antitoxin module)
MQEMNKNIATLLDNNITFTRGNYTSIGQLSENSLGTEGLMRKYLKGLERTAVRYTVNNTPIPTKILEGWWHSVPAAVIESFQRDIKDIYKEDKIAKLAKDCELFKRGMKEVDLILNDIKDGEIKLPEKYSLDAFKTALDYGGFDVRLDPYFLFKGPIEHLKSRKKLLDTLTPMQRDKILEMELQEIARNWQYRKIV